MTDDERMDPHQWVRTLAAALDLDTPSQAELDGLLAAAGTAAHTAERWVAPVSTWLLGRSDCDVAEGRAVIEQLSAAARDGDPAQR